VSVVFDSIGVFVVLAGIIILALEFIHPGALLLIPGSILLVGGLLFLFLPDVLLNSPFGIVVISAAALISALVEIPYYRWIAPTHGPMTTTSAGLVGEVGTVIAPVVPNTIRGKIRVRSEVWSVRADGPIPVGRQVRVIAGEGVSLKVVPVEEA
jgi:membrane protein implicated in regulation of membrane protease activity